MSRKLTFDSANTPEWGQVESLLSNGDVRLTTGEIVECADSYRNRSETDTVLIIPVSATEQVALGTVGGLARTDIDPNLIPRVQWGSSAPSDGGWISCNGGVYVKVESGQTLIYFTTSTPAPPPPPPGGGGDFWVTSQSTQGWRSGAIDNWYDGRPAQGKWRESTNGYWSGGWHFPDLASRVGGATVTRIDLEIERWSTNHGESTAVPQLYLSTSALPQNDTPARTDHWTFGDTPLGRGVRKAVTTNATWRTKLADGTAKTVVCFNNSTDNYAIFNGDARAHVFLA